LSKKFSKNAKKRNKTPSAFPLRLLLFVPCREFFDLSAYLSRDFLNAVPVDFISSYALFDCILIITEDVHICQGAGNSF